MPGQIMPIEEKFYPLDEAIQKAAEQNVRRDFYLHLSSVEKFEDLDAERQQAYKNFAYDLLCKIGKNYVPNPPDNERICVEPEKVFYPAEQAIKELADQLVQIAHDEGRIIGHTVDDLDTYDRNFFLTTARIHLEERGGVSARPNYPRKHIHVQK